MRCISPITLKDGIKVPCGHCVNCANNYRRSWSYRLEREQSVSDLVLWVRYSYSDDYLPTTQFRYGSLYFEDFPKELYPYLVQDYRNIYENSTDFLRSCVGRDILYDANPKALYLYASFNGFPFLVNQKKLPITFNSFEVDSKELLYYYPNLDTTQTLDFKDMSDMLDRLQHYLKYNYEATCKFFYCGEYGNHKTDNLRPHYHCFLFIRCAKNIAYDIQDIVKQQWNKGYVDIQVNPDTAAMMYTTKYSLKSDSPFPFGAVHPRIYCSRGLGSTVLEVNNPNDALKIKQMLNDYYTSDSQLVALNDGSMIALPRYYKNKLGKYLDTINYEDTFFNNIERKSKIKHNIDVDYIKLVSNAFHSYCMFHQPVLRSPPYDDLLLSYINEQVNKDYACRFWDGFNYDIGKTFKKDSTN